MHESMRIKNLPPYLFARINQLKMKARREGRDVIDLGMGNPDKPPHSKIIEKLTEVARAPKSHRYSASRGIPHLRRAICRWYEKRFGVLLDPEKEAIAVIGAKEGINHLALATLNKKDLVMVPNPTYPTHLYSVTIAGGSLYSIPLGRKNDWTPDLGKIPSSISSRAKMLLLNYPHNPTTQVVDSNFFKEAVSFARKKNLIVLHDFAYADLGFDNYQPPSFLQARGAKRVGVEFYSLTKG